MALRRGAKQRAAQIAAVLDEFIGLPEIPLNHRDPFTLLVAVALSAQCTDERVNKVTPPLFARAPGPKELAQMEVEEIEGLIRSCGLAPTKARNLKAMSGELVLRFDGEVPASLSDLESLPGVGHKTASVVMAQAFGVPAFPVDTHIARNARRWRLSDGKTVVVVERDLKRLFAEDTWAKVHLQIIHFSRRFCPARGHVIADCPVCRDL